MEFLYSSYETALKDETTKAFVPFFSSALTHSSDEINNSRLNNIQNNIHISPLQQDEARSSKNPCTSNNLKILPLGDFNSVIVNPIEDENITKVASIQLIQVPASSYDFIYSALKRTQGITN